MHSYLLIVLKLKSVACEMEKDNDESPDAGIL